MLRSIDSNAKFKVADGCTWRLSARYSIFPVYFRTSVDVSVRVKRRSTEESPRYLVFIQRIGYAQCRHIHAPQTLKVHPATLQPLPNPFRFEKRS
ncbi:uncharacterized protein RAG0_08288 [Rhynchosporium agropyri]|uniref:Uncharacterized protein n=1 Tax=Rhynchosporium agropyri TaxID=914238 RepID=A0A1E1KQ32_9HELO|nr:uncharacterized protein RAG0_08288 [Rhynchosporium agropyri]